MTQLLKSKKHTHFSFTITGILDSNKMFEYSPDMAVDAIIYKFKYSTPCENSLSRVQLNYEKNSSFVGKTNKKRDIHTNVSIVCATLIKQTHCHCEMLSTVIAIELKNLHFLRSKLVPLPRSLEDGLPGSTAKCIHAEYIRSAAAPYSMMSSEDGYKHSYPGS